MSTARRAWIYGPALAALAYAIAVVVVAWRAPDKGFLAFTGQRVVDVDAGGAAAGLREGDVIVAVDGWPVASTLGYADRVLRHAPGDVVQLGVTRDGARREVAVVMRASAPPWSALVATLLAAVLLALGLSVRARRPDDPHARRLSRIAIVYAVVYVGALSWPRLIVHPLLGGAFLLALFVGPAMALELATGLPQGEGARSRWRRRISIANAALLGAGCAAALARAATDLDGGDGALDLGVALIAAQIATIPVHLALGLWAQIRAHRVAQGELRAQLRWLLFGHALGAVPIALAIPVAIADLDRFLLVRYKPFVVAIAVIWFVAYAVAVLRVRLPDADALIRRSAGYAIATGGAALVYAVVVLAAGWATGRLVGESGPWPHVAAALVAAALFGPLRARSDGWLDRRFFRDRRHYVEALRLAGESLAVLREPAELAREAVQHLVGAVRAETGALYVRGAGEWNVAHAIGAAPDDGPDGSRGLDAPPRAPRGGIAIPVAGTRTDGQPAWLVLGPRRSGDLYSSEDRDLLVAIASQLAMSLENARAFGKLATMSRTLEAQNAEIRELRDRLEDENRFLRARAAAAGEGAALVGDSAAMRELLGAAERVARSDASVLLLGESGTGKGLLARMLHAGSARAERPFLHVDCGAIAAGVFESELFGHERGAFTGATRLRRGPIELADGGTLVLDEIGELPLELQPKLLRVLEERVISRVGATQPVRVDVRVIASTHRDLAAMVARGAFREDLYFRLRVVELVVPPLRARRADVPALVAALLPRAAKRCGRAARPVAEDAMAKLMAYAWPGNVRELGNVLERALVLGEGEAIEAADLELPERALPEVAAEVVSAPHDAVMEDIERGRLTAALAAAAGNQSHAAKALGIPRTTLINKLRRHGLL